MKNQIFTYAIHTESHGKTNVHYLVYGRNPFGPRGGSCGNFVDGRIVSSSTSWGFPPDWMRKAGKELEKMQIEPSLVEVHHWTYTPRFLIKSKKLA